MTREEILAKSKQENAYMDEREQQIVQKGKALSQKISITLCCLISLVCLWKDGPMIISHTAWTIVSIMYATDNWFLAVKLKKPFYWFLALVWTAAFFAYVRVLGNAFV